MHAVQTGYRCFQKKLDKIRQNVYNYLYTEWFDTLITERPPRRADITMIHRNRFAALLFLLTLLSVLLFTGCAQSAPEPADSDAVEIQIETEPLPPPPEPDSDAVLPAEFSILNEPPAETAVTEQAITTPAETTAPATAEQKASEQPHVILPRMANKPYADVQTLLDGAGITYILEEQYSQTHAAGEVITVRFHGAVDEEFCHINPNYPVEVVVSLGGRTKTNAAAVDPKRIYLTFDDGPHPNTDHVLEILAAYGIRATFFTPGMYVAVYPERAQAIANGGHLLACHSYSHDYMSLYQSAETVLDEIHAWEKAVEGAGVPLPETVFFRFPGGSTTSYMERNRYEEIFWAITDAGYLAMDWTFANNDRYLNGKTEDQTLEDYLLQSTAATLRNVESAPNWPKIMLMHDTADETVAALPQILDFLIAEGYTFGTLDELGGYWVFY